MQAHAFAALTHLYIRRHLKGSRIGTAAMNSLASIRHENLVKPTFYTTAEALTTVHDAQSHYTEYDRETRCRQEEPR